MGGVHDLYAFEGSLYGASVVCSQYSHGGREGLYELAVIRWNDDKRDDFTICYDTPITDDVLGHLTEQDVQDTLAKIDTLPA